MNMYRKLKERHTKEFNEFPIMFAFSDDQFKKGMVELGLNEDDTNKIYSIGAGGFIRKEDSSAFNDMVNRLDEEMKQVIRDDKTGEGFIKDMFAYELGNHEYGYTHDIDPTLNALNLTFKEVIESPTLNHGLNIAIRSCLEKDVG